MTGRWSGRLCGVAIAAALCLPARAPAQTEAGAQLTAAPAYQQALFRLEGGRHPAPLARAGESVTEPRLGFFALAPLNESEEPALKAHPGQPNRWYVGVSFGAETATGRKSGPPVIAYSAVDLGFNYHEFIHYPNGGSAAERAPSLSVLFAINEVRYAEAQEGAELIPSLSATYLYEHRGAAPGGIVVAGSGSAPSTVDTRIIQGPTAIAALVLRPGVIYDPDKGGAVRFAFSPQYTLYSNKNEGSPIGDKERLRLEAWAHLFPFADRRFRLQAGFFTDRVVRGNSEDLPTEMGVLFQLRYDIRPYDY